jgi:hypothetical protein
MVSTFQFVAELWEYGGAGSWVFVSLPADIADEIAELAPARGGFGSVRVEVRTDTVEWTTSLFPDNAARTYVLPVKKAVRERANIHAGESVEFVIGVIDD